MWSCKFKLSASKEEAFSSYHALEFYIEGHALVKTVVLLIVLLDFRCMG